VTVETDVYLNGLLEIYEESGRGIGESVLSVPNEFPRVPKLIIVDTCKIFVADFCFLPEPCSWFYWCERSGGGKIENVFSASK
jgi:hypothetical protein